MIEVLEVQGTWIFACDVRQVAVQPPKAGRQTPPPQMENRFSRCWTGDRWGSPDSVAMKFASERSATDYLEEHRRQIEGRL